MRLILFLMVVFTMSTKGAENIWINFPKNKKLQSEFVVKIKSKQRTLKKAKNPRFRKNAFLNIKLAEHLKELVDKGCGNWPGQFFSEFGIRNQLEPIKDMNVSTKQFFTFVDREVCPQKQK